MSSNAEPVPAWPRTTAEHALADRGARPALEGTLEVLCSPEAMRQLAESSAAVDAGDVLDADELASLMAERSKNAR